ncbi:MAG: Cna B-type domain-containing protein [Clostridia bacterium]|nr:Cna B-type domain-containing protein [Clostridia bacterium]
MKNAKHFLGKETPLKKRLVAFLVAALMITSLCMPALADTIENALDVDNAEEVVALAEETETEASTEGVADSDDEIEVEEPTADETTDTEDDTDAVDFTEEPAVEETVDEEQTAEAETEEVADVVEEEPETEETVESEPAEEEEADLEAEEEKLAEEAQDAEEAPAEECEAVVLDEAEELNEEETELEAEEETVAVEAMDATEWAGSNNGIWYQFIKEGIGPESTGNTIVFATQDNLPEDASRYITNPEGTVTIKSVKNTKEESGYKYYTITFDVGKVNGNGKPEVSFKYNNGTNQPPIVGKVKITEAYATPVYVYARFMEGDKTFLPEELSELGYNLVINEHGYYTVGKIPAVNIQPASDSTKGYVADYAPKAIAALSTIERYTVGGQVVNAGINIAERDPAKDEFKYVFDGADGYVKSNDVNPKTWHLDIVIPISTVGNYRTDFYLQNEDGTYSETASFSGEIHSATRGETATSDVLDSTAYPNYTFDEDADNEITPVPVVAGTTIVFKRYYKLNKYTVSYDYEGTVPEGAEDAPADADYAQGTAVTVASEPATIVGYTFSGWETDDAEVTGGTFTMPAKDVTFTGSWTKNTHNVSYSYTGDVPEGADEAPAITEGVEYGTTVTVEPAPTYEGWSFSGWETDDAEVADGEFTMPDKDVEFVGSWTKNTHTVSYSYTGDVPEGADEAPAITEGVEYGTTVTVEPAPTFDDYTFSGWDTDDVEVADGEFTMPDKDVAFTGEWTRKQYTVTYVYYDGEDAVKPAEADLPPLPGAETHISGETVRVAEDLYVPGYWFNWGSDDVIINEYTGTFDMPKQNVTIIGFWQPIDYVVTYDWTPEEDDEVINAFLTNNNLTAPAEEHFSYGETFTVDETDKYSNNPYNTEKDENGKIIGVYQFDGWYMVDARPMSLEDYNPEILIPTSGYIEIGEDTPPYISFVGEWGYMPIAYSNTTVTVEKKWEDNDDLNGVRPESVEVQLFVGEGEEGELAPFGDPVTLSEENSWTYTWEDLEETFGEIEYYYSVEELHLDELEELGYTCSIADPVETESGITFVISNTNDEIPVPPPAQDDVQMNLTVNKVWDDEGHESERPESIKVQLLRNGEAYEVAELSEATAWTYTWEDLVVETADEVTYDYDIEEIEVADVYEVAIELDDSDANNRVITLTNSYVEEPTPAPSEDPTPVPSEEPTPVPSESPTTAPTSAPNTGDESNNIMWILLMGAAAGLFVITLCVYIKRKSYGGKHF